MGGVRARRHVQARRRAVALVREWRLYPPLVEYFHAQGLRAATQVTDPRGARWEVDVAAFTPDLADVRVVEAKVEPSHAHVRQCLDRLRLAERVYAAVPAGHAAGLREAAEGADADAAAIGLLTVDPADGAVEVLREATPAPERREEGPARVLERALRETLV